VQHRDAGLAGVDAAPDVGAGLEHEGGVLGVLAAGDALDDDLRALVQIDRHVFFPRSRRARLAGVGELDSLVGARIHGGGQGNQRVVGRGEEAASSSSMLLSRRTTSGL
jgi:hypothetical protein